MALSNLDRELLRDCLAKAPDAWENFSDRFLGLVIHVVNHTALMRNVSLSQELREDLVADVFVSWIDKDFAVLRRFQGKSSLATYLAVVARRVVFRRMSQMRLPHNHQSIESLKLDPPAQETKSLTQDEFEKLESSIERLSQEEATAVRMFHLQGKSYREISSQIGMPENSIGPFLSRARDKFVPLFWISRFGGPNVSLVDTIILAQRSNTDQQAKDSFSRNKKSILEMTQPGETTWHVPLNRIEFLFSLLHLL